MNMMKMVDAILCIRKYIILLCERKLFLGIYINGINDIRFISSPIHRTNQFLALIIIIVLPMVVEKNNNFDDVFIIKKKKV